MATLDVLDYTTRVEEALEDRLPRGDRRQAAREARGVLDAMAWRFAFMDERPLPEDVDWTRALEAVRPPEKAADVLVRRAPAYRRRRIRRRVTSFGILGVLVLAGVLVVQLSLSQASTPLLTHNEAVGSLTPYATVTRSEIINFTVPEGALRLDFTATVITQEGYVNVTLLDPQARIPFRPPHDEPMGFDAKSGYYERATLPDPQPGEWNLVIDYVAARASVDLHVQSVHPRT